MNKRIISTIITVIITIFLIIFIIYINRENTISEPMDEAAQPSIEACENVYILSNENGVVRYLKGGSAYDALGSLDAEHLGFTGFADIKINSIGEFIEVTEYKTECLTGTLLAYSNTQVKVEGYGWMDFSDSLQVFRTYNNKLESVELADFVVGATVLHYYTDKKGVCGLIQDSQTATEDIRVVIKNDTTNEIYYDELYLFSNGEWSANSESIPSATTFDVAAYMRQNDQNQLVIESSSPIALTDDVGRKKSEYYEGSLTIVAEDPTKAFASDNSRLVVVNTLPIETYVRYVLPSEMPKSFGYEAKKAQAVCARTYAYSQMKNSEYALYGANLDDSTMYQVYNANGTTAETDKAALDTAGLIASTDGDLITCYYFSTAPGFTHGLEAWGEEDVNYLSFHNQTLNDYGDLSIASNVRKALEDAPSTYDSDSPFYRWRATLDFSASRIKNARDPELGSLKSFKITKRTKAGYVSNMELIYTRGTKDLTSELEVRRFFGSFLTKLQLNNASTRTDFKILPCAFFVNESQYESFTLNSLSGKKMTLMGGGFGHGIGMSQYGANGMSASGKNYSEIINYYYDNVELINVKELDAFK